DWSSDVCSSDLPRPDHPPIGRGRHRAYGCVMHWIASRQAGIPWPDQLPEAYHQDGHAGEQTVNRQVHRRSHPAGRWLNHQKPDVTMYAPRLLPHRVDLASQSSLWYELLYQRFGYTVTAFHRLPECPALGRRRQSRGWLRRTATAHPDLRANRS